MTQNHDVEVVVAGAGAAGLAAALAAGAGGRTVALLEATETFRTSNNTSMSTSMIPAGGSRWQLEASIDDSPDTFLADIQAKTKGAADPVISRALVDVAPELVAWLADAWDIPLSLVTDFIYPGHSQPRCHTVPDRAGRTLHGHLLDALAHVPAELITPMSCAGVRVHDGEVVGVDARVPDGATEQIRTPKVVLATGGFGANARLVERYTPEIVDGVYFGGEGCQGDALRIAEDLSADTGYLNAYQGHGSLVASAGVLAT